jgi:hypothetical protein
MTLSITDYKNAAGKLGVDVASVRAIARVESSGKGFLSDGRPIILYERHIFYRELLAKRNKEEKNKIKLAYPLLVGPPLDTKIAAALATVKTNIDVIIAQKPTICNTVTGGYIGGVKEYDRLTEAKTIDEEVALRSCSWGAFQVMGYHAESLSYSDVFQFVEAAKTDQGQLDIFIRFILANPSLLKALKMQNWAGFAKLYNGPGYKNHKIPYDTQLIAAFNMYSTGGSNIA